jgi:hypothetical protein
LTDDRLAHERGERHVRPLRIGFRLRVGVRPTVPLVPAGLNVWQLPQAPARKTDFATLVDVAGAATVTVRVTV